MGACFLTTTYDGALSAAELRKEFDDLQRRAKDEHGSSYSGSWNMASGLDIRAAQTFTNEREADEYVENKAQKWEEAVAVRVTPPKGPAYWYVGAWCAS